MAHGFPPVYRATRSELYGFVQHPLEPMWLHPTSLDLLLNETQPEGEKFIRGGFHFGAYTLGQVLEAFVRSITHFCLYDPTNPEILKFKGNEKMILGHEYIHYLDLAPCLHFAGGALESCGSEVSEPRGLIQANWLYSMRLPPLTRLLHANVWRYVDPYKDYIVSDALAKVFRERGFTVATGQGLSRMLIFRLVREYLQSLPSETFSVGSTVHIVKGTPFARLGRMNVLHSTQLEVLIGNHCRPK